MGKRSDFERRERDYYPTPVSAVLPLLPYIKDIPAFCEPCVGDGAIVRALGDHVPCFDALDVEPIGEAIVYARHADALTLKHSECEQFTHFITNPPWPSGRAGEPTMGLIRHLADLRPTWMLLPADFMHNRYASEVMNYCQMIVSVGRVKWIEDSDHAGKDNAAWYHFYRHVRAPCQFIPRQEAA
jgi:hypothetical protein